MFVMIIIASLGSPPAVAYFANQAACNQTLQVLEAALKTFRPVPAYIITCQPTDLKQQPQIKPDNSP